MKKGTLKQWITVLMAVILTISLFAIPAFANEAQDTVDAVVDLGAGATGTEEHDEHDGHDHGDTTTTTTEEGLSTKTLIGLIITGVVLLVLVVLGIKFREKVGKFFRVYKSESKKIVWLTWAQTLKSSYVVIVILVIGAVALCALDLGLNTGLREFIELFTKTA